MTIQPGHLYVVEVRPGVCKIGRSTHRFDRLAAYAKRETELLAWSSPAFVGHRGAETHLIHTLAARHRRAEGVETFAVDFAAAVRAARATVRAVTLDNAAAA